MRLQSSVRDRATVLVGALLLLGVLLCCKRTALDFEPNFAGRQGVVCVRATRFYDGDAESILAAGGVKIGEIQGRGDLHDLSNEAALLAAEKGGTHYILTDKQVRNGFIPITPASVHCVHRNGSSDCDFQEAAGITTEETEARFIVVRVEPSRWWELSSALLPRTRRSSE